MDLVEPHFSGSFFTDGNLWVTAKYVLKNLVDNPKKDEGSDCLSIVKIVPEKADCTRLLALVQLLTDFEKFEQPIKSLQILG